MSGSDRIELNELSVVPDESDRMPVPQDPSFEMILASAVDQKMPPESMEKLLAVYERMQASKARSLFSAAMTEFRASCPPIPRRTENRQFMVNRNGIQVPRMYSSLEDMEREVRGPLGRCGLSYRWGNAAVTGGMMTLPFILTHSAGHSESSSVTLPLESRAGSSEVQKYGTVLTYAMRYSMIQGLGLTTCEDDADGNDTALDAPKITDEQALTLEGKVADYGADLSRFVKYLGVERLADLPETRFSEALEAIEKKRPKGTP